jgi:Zn-dependent protease/predicted transcriptional regulator
MIIVVFSAVSLCFYTFLLKFFSVGNAFKLFTWLNIPVRLHWTFGLIFVYIYYEWEQQGAPLSELPWLFVLVMAMFFCVLLHEYGHALAGRRYGIGTRDIVLTPIGGIARLERMPDKPVQEFVVAIAGPVVNIVIAGLLYVLFTLFLPSEWQALQSGEEIMVVTDDISGDVVEQFPMQISSFIKTLHTLLFVNIGLALFNLLPIFPMDGGRILRALLSMKMGRPGSTRIAAGIGQLVALAGGAYALWSGHYQLLILAIFIFFAARTENSMVQLEAFLQQYKASDVMRPQFTRFYFNDWIKTAIDLLPRSLERHFLVFDLNDRPIGALEEDTILEAMQKNKRSTEVSDCMSALHIAHPDDPLHKVHHLIRHQGCGIVAVADENGLLGVIDEAGLLNFLRVTGPRSYA